MQNIERRQLPRIPIRTPAKLHCDSEPLPVLVLELSEQGMGIESPVDLSPNQTCEVELTLHLMDENFALTLPFEVVHTTKTNKDYLVGVKFKPLSATYHYALKRFIQHAQLNGA